MDGVLGAGVSLLPRGDKDILHFPDKAEILGQHDKTSSQSFKFAR